APAQVPALGYEIYYNTTGVSPDSSTVLDGSNSVSTSAGSLSGTISGLTSGTQYYVWVRGKCGATDSSNWSSVLSFATTCNAVSAPYYESFDSTPVGSTTNPNAPACWSYLETAGSAGSGYISTSTALSAPHSYVLANGADTTGDVMLVSPQTSNLSDGTREVRFSVRAGGNNYTMDVGTLSDPSNPVTFNVISTVSLTQTYVEHIVALPAASNQYVAFRHGLGGSSRTVYLDDIFVEKIPTCFEPSNVQVTAGSVTSSSGVLSWTAPTTAATGYEVYYSTVNVAPTPTTVLDATNSVSVSGTTATISGLLPSTTYYVWVRSVCSATDKSIWTPSSVTLSTFCDPPVITTTTGATICTGNAILSAAAASSGATIVWYDAATGGNQVGTGGSFTTPVLTGTTNYWVTANSIGTPTSVGPVSPASLGTSSNTNTNWNLLFTVSSNITLNSVDVFSGTAGQAGVVEILDANDVVVGSFPFTTLGAGASTPQTIPLNIALVPGNYSMKRT